MKTYVIEDLTPENIQQITERLNEMELGAGMDGLYWLPLPQEMLSDVQKEHAECGPHCMALEIVEGTMRMELLVRARNILRCECVSYASAELRLHMMRYLDDMLDELGIYA